MHSPHAMACLITLSNRIQISSPHLCGAQSAGARSRMPSSQPVRDITRVAQRAAPAAQVVGVVRSRAAVVDARRLVVH